MKEIVLAKEETPKYCARKKKENDDGGKNVGQTRSKRKYNS